MGCEQSDDLLFFVVNEAYQVRFASRDGLPHRNNCALHMDMARLGGLCFSC